MRTAERLHAAVSAVCHIDGVSIRAAGSAIIHPAATATPAQILAGDAALASFDWSDTAQAAWEVAQARGSATAEITDLDGVVIRAVVEVMVDQINVLRAIPAQSFPVITYAQAKAAILAKIAAGAAD